MRVLVCGASGLVGRQLCKDLGANNIDWVGTGHTNTLGDTLCKVDLADPAKVAQLLERAAFDACVNCVAERNVNACEENWPVTKRVNIDIAHTLAQTCAQRGVCFIHISTDYVFDGRSPPYSPKSSPNPLQNYGISKLVAEQRVQAACPEALIVRVPVLFNAGTLLKESSVTSVFRTVLDQTKVVDLDGGCARHPVFVPDLCAFIVHHVQFPGLSGIHHFSSNTTVSKHDMADMAAKYLRKPLLARSTSNVPGADRPADTEFTPPHQATTPFEAAMKQCLHQLWHPKIVTGNVFLLINPKVMFQPETDGTGPLMAGALDLIDAIVRHQIPYAMVTDAHKCDHVHPAFQKIANWAGSHELAIANHKPPHVEHVVVIENTFAKCRSLSDVTRAMYVVSTAPLPDDLDVFCIRSLDVVLL